MRYRTTIQLGVIAVILGCGLYILDDHLNRRQTTRVLVHRVFDITNVPVAGVGFERDGVRVECVRKGDIWFLQSPMRARANSPLVERIVSSLETLKWEDYISREHRELRNLSFADYGLDPAAMRIMLETEGGRSETLFLGDQAPFGGVVYSRIDRSDLVLTLPESVFTLFPADISSLRERAVLYGESEKTERIDIYRRDAGFVQLVRQKSGLILQQPLEARADGAAVKRLLDAVFGMQVVNFHWDAAIGDEGGEDVLARTEMVLRAQVEAGGLAADAARIKVAVWTEGDRLGQEVFLGRTANETGSEVYARKGGVDAVYTVSAGIVDACSLAVDALRDRAVFSAVSGEIGFVSLKHGETRVELQRRLTGGWKMVAPVQANADSEAVTMLLTKLLSLRVSSYVPVVDSTNLLALELDPPQMEIQLGALPMADAPVAQKLPPDGVVRLLLGSVPEGGLEQYAKMGRNDEVFTLAAESVEGLDETLVTPLRFRSRLVLAVQTGSVFRVQVTQAPGEVRIERDPNEVNGWRCLDAPVLSIDQAALGDLLAAASRIEAVRFVAFQPDSLAVYGLDKPTATITFGLKGVDGIQKALLLGRTEEGLVYAMIQGYDFVFLLTIADAGRFTQRLCGQPFENEPDGPIATPEEEPSVDGPSDEPYGTSAETGLVPAEVIQVNEEDGQGE